MKKMKVLQLCLLIAAAHPANAQSPESLIQNVEDYKAFMDAEANKSPLCRSYQGKPIILTRFDALAERLAGPAPKGEYETTAEYSVRRTEVGARRGLGPVAIAVPLDRDHVRYDADVGAFMVLAGAFPAGSFSDAPQANMAAEIAVLTAKDRLGTTPRLAIGLPGTEKTVSTGTARNVFGAAVQTAEVDRRTRGLSLTGNKIFGFARDAESTVTGFEASPAKAPAMKAGLRAALVVEPEAPYILTNIMPGATATNRKPVHYTERATIITARARCALILDAQSRVLASADAGLVSDAR
nr:hypothetical protein [uncultured Sphingomonas sp.]